MTYVFGAILMLGSGACTRTNDGMHLYTGYTQGTTFRIITAGVDDTLMLRHKTDSVLAMINKVFSVYDSMSVVSRINRNEAVEIPEPFIQLFRKSMEISEATGGAFDITVGPLVKSWGFWKREGIPPDSATVKELLNLTGYRKVYIEQGKVVKNDPRMMLDFNAIAQGYTVDMLYECLRESGCTHILVEVGGEVRGSHGKPGGSPWSIGIEQPAGNDTAPQILDRTISLSDRAIATSGSYRKYFIRNGVRYSHTIDPATGYPVSHSLLSVTVIAPECTRADALATAFMVMGTAKAMKYLEQHPGTEALFITADTGGHYHYFSTPGFDTLNND